MRSLWRCLLLVALAASASTCGKGSPTAPTPASNSTTGSAATRVVSLGGSLTFGAVEIGKTSELTLTIGNTGTGTLSVTGITVPGGYTPNWTSGTIAPGASQQVAVRFAPLAAQSYDGLLTVHGDHTAGSNTAPLSGTGAERAPARATLTGIATEQGAGVLGGATIEIRDGPDARTWTTTDEAGRFTLAGLQPGDVTVRASKSGYTDTDQRITLAAGGVAALNFTVPKIAAPAPPAPTPVPPTPPPTTPTRRRPGRADGIRRRDPPTRQQPPPEHREAGPGEEPGDLGAGKRPQPEHGVRGGAVRARRVRRASRRDQGGAGIRRVRGRECRDGIPLRRRRRECLAGERRPPGEHRGQRHTHGRQRREVGRRGVVLHADLLLTHDWQLDEARPAGRMVDALHRFPVVAGLRPEDVRHERLRIAIVEREPARLDLHHDPVAGQEHVVRRRQREPVEQRRVGGDGLRGSRGSRGSGRGRCRPTSSTGSRPAPAARPPRRGTRR